MHYGDKEISDMISKMHNAEKLNMGHRVDKSMPLKLEDVQLDERIAILKVDCYTCFKESELRTFQCEIPFFKEVIIMSFKCHHCGYKDTEVKIGGEVSPTAKKITLEVTNEDDLNRDIFKSDTAVVRIKELEFEMMPGSLGSFYTTVEGLMGLIIDKLEMTNPFKGDSSEEARLKVTHIIFLLFLSDQVLLKNSISFI
jgi:zinc finger protein